MEWKEYYCEWIKRSFSKPFLVAEAVATSIAIFGGLVSSLYPRLLGKINLLMWLVPLMLLFALLIVSLFLSSHSLYKELLHNKAEEYYKYSEDAKKDRLHRIFCKLYKYGEFERNTCPDRIMRWEEELQRMVIDNFSEEVIRRYRLNINMICGPDNESTTKKRFEWAMNFVKEQLDSDFSGTLTPL